jgi:hypothetical protein
MDKIAVLTLTVLALASCHGSGTSASQHTEREHDSILGQSTLPGARGVQGALKVSDTAQAHRAALDSAAAAP